MSEVRSKSQLKRVKSQKCHDCDLLPFIEAWQRGAEKAESELQDALFALNQAKAGWKKAAGERDRLKAILKEKEAE